MRLQLGNGSQRTARIASLRLAIFTTTAVVAAAAAAAIVVAALRVAAVTASGTGGADG